MHIHRWLASIAKLELNALLKETKNAVNGLQRQRESAAEALEMAQHANQCSGQPSDETDTQIPSLVDSVCRLDAALDHVKREIEQLEARSMLPSTEPFIILPLPMTQAPNDNHSPVEAVNPRPTPHPDH